MPESEFLKFIDELMEKDPGTLKGPELLEENGWDSLSVISFIALVDEHFGFTVSPAELAKCTRVEDLVSLVSGRLQPA